MIIANLLPDPLELGFEGTGRPGQNYNNQIQNSFVLLRANCIIKIGFGHHFVYLSRQVLNLWGRGLKKMFLGGVK